VRNDNEFDQVALTVDLPEYNLIAGDVATVVDITANDTQVTLEFFNFEGDTIAVVPVESMQVRPVAGTEVMHARQMARS
jgi:hypothetical protein